MLRFFPIYESLNGRWVMQPNNFKEPRPFNYLGYQGYPQTDLVTNPKSLRFSNKKNKTKRKHKKIKKQRKFSTTQRPRSLTPGGISTLPSDGFL